MKPMKTLSVILILLLALAPAAFTMGSRAAGTSSGAEAPLSLTYVANMGVLVESGGTKVLIDALFDKPNPAYRAPEPAVLEKIIEGEASFDAIVLALITHNHPDHFAPAVAVRFLESRTQTIILAPADAVAEMRRTASDWEKLEPRVISFDLENGDFRRIKAAGIPITAVRTLHSGDFESPMNLMYLFEIDGREDIAYFLMDKGAVLDIQKQGPMRFLRAVLSAGMDRIANLLIMEKDVDYGNVDGLGNTLLHAAARSRETTFIGLLAEKGVDPNATNIYGWSPLHIAASLGHEKVIETLFRNGADKRIRTKDGKTPFNLADESGKAELSAFLKEKKFSPAPAEFPKVSARHIFGPQAGEPGGWAEDAKPSWCLGWIHIRSSLGECYFHVGAEEGLENFAVFFPKQGAGLVIFSSGPSPAGVARDAVERVFGTTGIPFAWMGYE